MTEMRDKRVKREFAATVDRRKHSALTVLRTFKNARLPETEIMPQGPDFCHFSVISEVLNQTADVEVDVSSFNNIIPLLPGLVMEWRKSIKQEMIQVIKMHNSRRRLRGRSFLDFLFDNMDGNTDEDEAPPDGPNSHLTDEELSQKLTLASTVFTCNCGSSYSDYQTYDSDDDVNYWPASKILFYPQVMGHSCLARVSKMFPWEFSATTDPSCLLESCRFSERKQWDSSSLSLHPTASITAQHIIRLAGLDPDLATSNEMDQSNIRFGCEACARVPSEGDEDDPDDNTFRVFDWRGVVSRLYATSLHPISLMPVIQIIHQTNRHPTQSIGSTLEKLSEDGFTVDLRKAESEHWAKVDYIWSCMHCRDSPKETKADTLDGVEKHISRM